MKFNPLTQELFTNDGQFVKRMYCPYGVRWDELEPGSGTAPHRSCAVCKHAILDTAVLADAELQDIVHAAPETCLKIDLEQPNLIVTPHVRREELS